MSEQKTFAQIQQELSQKALQLGVKLYQVYMLENQADVLEKEGEAILSELKAMDQEAVNAKANEEKALKEAKAAEAVSPPESVL